MTQEDFREAELMDMVKEQQEESMIDAVRIVTEIIHGEALIEEAGERISNGEFEAEDLLMLYEKAQSARRSASDTERYIEMLLAEKLRKENRTLETDDGKEVRSAWRPGTTKWDQQAILNALFERALENRQVNKETGEIESEIEAVNRVVNECVSLSYARVGALQNYSLNPDLYREQKDGRWGVRIETKREVQ